MARPQSVVIRENEKILSFVIRDLEISDELEREVREDRCAGKLW
jgi:hypothetical protein